MKNIASLVSVLAVVALSCSKAADGTNGGVNAGAAGSLGGSAGSSPVGAGGNPAGGAPRGSSGAGDSAGSSNAGGSGNAGSSSAGASDSGSAGNASAGGNGNAGAAGASTSSACNGSVHSTAAAGPTATTIALTVPTGFTLTTIAKVTGARELAALPNGDLLVGTSGMSVYLVPNADAASAPGAPVVFTTAGEKSPQGVAFDSATCSIYVSSEHNIYKLAYKDAQQSGTIGTPIATVRTGSIAPNRPSGDTDNHTSTSVAVAGGVLYAGIGSSCNACVETDATRASIQRLDLSGANIATRATRLRNAIALTPNPATGTLWAGGAGQDNLTEGHPYEFFDAITSHAGVADYGWPACEENHVAYTSGASCAATVAPLVVLPAYSTIIGATFYPTTQSGAYAFPATYKGGLFLTAHGSWHTTTTNGPYVSTPQVVFVPMNGDAPQTAVDWTDPTKQWTQFVGGFQLADNKTRVARPTGIAVGALGSLFIADDQTGYIFRVRPN